MAGLYSLLSTVGSAYGLASLRFIMIHAALTGLHLENHQELQHWAAPIVLIYVSSKTTL